MNTDFYSNKQVTPQSMPSDKRRAPVLKEKQSMKMQQGYANTLSKICVRKECSKQSHVLTTLDSGSVVFVLDIVGQRAKIDFNGEELGWCTFFLESEQRFLLRHEKNQKKAKQCFDAQDHVNMYEEQYFEYVDHASGFDKAKIKNQKMTKSKLYSRVEKRKLQVAFKINKIDNSGRHSKWKLNINSEKIEYNRPDIQELATKSDCPKITIYERLLIQQKTFEKMYIKNSQAYSYACANLDIKSKSRDEEIEFIQFLIEHGKNERIQHHFWEYAFLIACEIGHIAMIKFLNRQEVDISTKLGSHGDNALILASENNQLEVIKLLVDHYRFSINTKDYYGQSIFNKAYVQKNFELLTYYCQKGVDFKEKENIFWRIFRKKDYKMLNFFLKNCFIRQKVKDKCFFNACLREDIEMVKYFLKHGINVDITDKNGSSACLKSCEKNNLELYKLLVTNGANMKLKNNHGLNGFVICCKNGSFETLKYLINQWGKKDGEFESACQQGFECACENNQKEVIEYLMNENHDFTQNCGFIYACGHGEIDLVRALIDRGQNMEVTNVRNGHTGLMEACKNGCLNVVELLVEMNVNLETRDHRRQTVLIYACISGSIPILKFLIDQGVNVDGKAFNIACKEGNLETVRYLLNLGVNTERKGEAGRTGFILACFYGYVQVVDFLIKQNAVNVNATDKDGRTGFFLACMKGYIEIVHILIKHDVNTEIKDIEGDTAFVYACKQNNFTMVKLLNENRKITEESDQNQVTGLMYACQNDFFEISNFLFRESSTFSQRTKYFLCACKEYASVDILTILIHQGVDFNATLDSRTGFDLLFDTSISSSVVRGVRKLINHHKFMCEELPKIWMGIDLYILQITLEFCCMPRLLEHKILQIKEHGKYWFPPRDLRKWMKEKSRRKKLHRRRQENFKRNKNNFIYAL